MDSEDHVLSSNWQPRLYSLTGIVHAKAEQKQCQLPSAPFPAAGCGATVRRRAARTQGHSLCAEELGIKAPPCLFHQRIGSMGRGWGINGLRVEKYWVRVETSISTKTPRVAAQARSADRYINVTGWRVSSYLELCVEISAHWLCTRPVVRRAIFPWDL